MLCSLEEKAREKMRRLKEKRSELEHVAHKMNQKRERDREERKKQMAEQRRNRRYTHCLQLNETLSTYDHYVNVNLFFTELMQELLPDENYCPMTSGH